MHALQVPGGWAAQLYGGRRVLSACFFMWSMASFLTPSNASSVFAMTLARVCVGVAQGFLIPSVHTVLSQVLYLLFACRFLVTHVSALSHAAL